MGTRAGGELGGGALVLLVDAEGCGVWTLPFFSSEKD